MTEQQLEIAARKLCELRGLDPEAKITHGADPDENGFVVSIAYISPRWKLVKKEIQNYLLIQEAIDFASNIDLNERRIQK